MISLIVKLYRTKLLTLGGLRHFLTAVMTTGVNLMTLLQVAAKLHPHRVAVMDDRDRLTYPTLWQQTETLAILLQDNYGIQTGQKVAIVCRSHSAAIKAIFALSRLGVHVFLLNPELSPEQVLTLAEHWQFDFYLYDEAIAPVFTNPSLSRKSIPAYHPTHASIDRLSSQASPSKTRLKKVKSGNLVVMTGGTTGQPKAASRQPSLFKFLPPFVALLTQVQLDRYQSVYIATPIYHGFGLASLLIGVVLGAELHVTQRFNAAQACDLIAQNSIEVVTLVPLMLQRMLTIAPESLSSLQCIITGGAQLNPTLAQASLNRLGLNLFNLYGTSEAGVCILATPALLSRKPESIGQPIWGVQAKIVNETDRGVGGRSIGRLCIRSAWTISQANWIETGDLAYRDAEGDIVLCGRVDDMIVSGGENVYPIELENVLMQHPDVESVAVAGIPDREFGQRLKAVVVKKQETTLDQTTLLNWLKPRVARYQMPTIVEFCDQLPYTALGKLDKRLLRKPD